MRAIEATPFWRVAPLVEVSLYGPDQDTGYAHRPGVTGYWRTENRTHIRISAQGLRDDETSYAKPKNTFRVALLGDSITEALQVELRQTYQAVMERRFAERGRAIQVVNLALAGATPAVSVARLRSHARRFSPDMAVLVHSAGDLLSPAMTDDSRFPAYRPTPSGIHRLSYGFRSSAGFQLRSSIFGRLIYWLTDHSRFAGALNGRLNVGWFAELNRTPSPRKASVVSAGACDMSALKRQVMLWKEQEPRRTNAVLNAFLRDLQDYRSKSGQPVVLALFAIAPGCKTALPLRASLVTQIRARLAAHGIELHDVDAALRANRPSNRRWRDLRGFGVRLGVGHLNPLGHQIMARALETAVVPHLPAR